MFVGLPVYVCPAFAGPGFGSQSPGELIHVDLEILLKSQFFILRYLTNVVDSEMNESGTHIDTYAADPTTST